MSGAIELEIPADEAYLGLARRLITTAAALDPLFKADRFDDLQIVVSELTTNAILAQRRSGSLGRISLRFNLNEDRFEVWVTDAGTGFDPSAQHELPEIGDPRRLEYEGGFGLKLVAALTDFTEINSTQEGTSVRVVYYASRTLDVP